MLYVSILLQIVFRERGSNPPLPRKIQSTNSRETHKYFQSSPSYQKSYYWHCRKNCILLSLPKDFFPERRWITLTVFSEFLLCVRCWLGWLGHHPSPWGAPNPGRGWTFKMRWGRGCNSHARVASTIEALKREGILGEWNMFGAWRKSILFRQRKSMSKDKEIWWPFFSTEVVFA